MSSNEHVSPPIATANIACFTSSGGDGGIKPHGIHVGMCASCTESLQFTSAKMSGDCP